MKKLSALLALLLGVSLNVVGTGHCVRHNPGCSRYYQYHTHNHNCGEPMGTIKYNHASDQCVCDKSRCALHRAQQTASDLYHKGKEKTQETMQATKDVAVRTGRFAREAAENVGHTLKETAYKVANDLKEGAIEAKKDIARAKKHSSRTL